MAADFSSVAHPDITKASKISKVWKNLEAFIFFFCS